MIGTKLPQLKVESM